MKSSPSLQHRPSTHVVILFGTYIRIIRMLAMIAALVLGACAGMMILASLMVPQAFLGWLAATLGWLGCALCLGFMHRVACSAQLLAMKRRSERPSSSVQKD